MDVLFEVFEVTLRYIIQNNNFGHRFEETPAYIKVSITDTRKAVFIFNNFFPLSLTTSLVFRILVYVFRLEAHLHREHACFSLYFANCSRTHGCWSVQFVVL